MVNSCAATDCTNHYKAVLGIFSLIPSQQTRAIAKNWTQAVKRKGWNPNKHSFICSVHFEPSCLKYEWEILVARFVMM